MNTIQRELWRMLKRGDPSLRKLFVEYVQNMGHTKKETEMIVESVLNGKSTLNELSLSKLSRFGDNVEEE